MLDVLELEKRWSKYHFKKVLPLYLITITIVAILVLVPGYIYMTNPKLIEAYLPQDETATANRSTKIVEKTVIKPATQTVSTQSIVIYEQNILVPSFLFLRSLDDQLIIENNRLKLAAIAAAKPVAKKTPKKKKVQKRKPKKVAKKPKKVAKAKPKPKPKAKPKKVATPAVKPVEAVVTTKTNVTVLGDNSQYKQSKPEVKPLKVGHQNTSQSQLNSVIKRFKKTKKPALGLFISNKFYEQGDYQEAYNYAKQTYKINPNIEGAVLLYAKSLTKLGKKDKAISKLKPYIKKTGSIKAITLLNQINKGTL